MVEIVACHPLMLCPSPNVNRSHFGVLSWEQVNSCTLRLAECGDVNLIDVVHRRLNCVLELSKQKNVEPSAVLKGALAGAAITFHAVIPERFSDRSPGSRAAHRSTI